MEHTIVYSTKMKGRSFDHTDPKIKVIGVGAAGTNIIGNLYKDNASAELISVNTDWTQLSAQKADKKLLIGVHETNGLGCGGDVVKGRNAARESIAEIKSTLDSSDLIFLIGGLGNGTATGGLPVIANEALKKGATVVGFIIIPFFFKKSDVEKAQMALKNMHRYMNTTIVLDLNKLQDTYHDLPLTDSFSVMNDTVSNSIQALISMIKEPELIEVNFSHIKEALTNGMYGTIGIDSTEKSFPLTELAEQAIRKELFHFDPKNAKSAIVHITGDKSLSLSMVKDLVEPVSKFLLPGSPVHLGAKVDEKVGNDVTCVIILTGMEPEHLVFKSELSKMKF